ncbi:MAG: GH3 auxin-responsive promoter family protein [Planctomycetota bacterium]|nr:GH3 auxin-responsive promoter family protein [Planctomycetota bacterium]
MPLSLTLLRMALYPGARRFHNALQDPEKAQTQLLKTLVRDASQSLYGTEHSLRSTDDFFKLPIVNYEDLEPWIERQKRGEPALTTKRVLFYEKTSGSSGAAKYIPYTASLKSSFSRMFAAWAYDLLKHGPAFHGGKLYFSVSPNFDEQEVTEAGVPVGLEDDSDYLDGLLKTLFNRYFVNTQRFSRTRDPEQFKIQVIAALLNEPRLEIISVWNPSFLQILLKTASQYPDKIKVLLKRPEIPDILARSPVPWEEIWPQLKLISCWTRGAAKEKAAQLKSIFPKTMIQGKGLLATEAPLTIPMLAAGQNVCIPMLNEVFFEFEDSTGQILTLSQIKPNTTYSLIISQRGGFLRYRMGDRVKLHGSYLQCPGLDFLGRDSSVVDLVGEKLNSSFVEDCLASPPFTSYPSMVLIPLREPEHYRLLIETTQPSEALLELAEELEQRLSASYHYRHARRLGQLGPSQVLGVQGLDEDVARLWMERGGKWGDMKAKILQSLEFGRLYQDKANDKT